MSVKLYTNRFRNHGQALDRAAGVGQATRTWQSRNMSGIIEPGLFLFIFKIGKKMCRNEIGICVWWCGGGGGGGAGAGGGGAHATKQDLETIFFFFFFDLINHLEFSSFSWSKTDELNSLYVYVVRVAPVTPTPKN